MFKDMNTDFQPYDMKNPSKERIDKDIDTVFSRLELSAETDNKESAEPANKAGGRFVTVDELTVYNETGKKRRNLFIALGGICAALALVFAVPFAINALNSRTKTQSDSGSSYASASESGAPDASSQQSTPDSVIVVSDIESIPAESKPESTPAESKPESTPAETEPESTPAETEPESTPAETEPESTPAESEPESTPAEAEPESTPAETEPESTPAESKPESTPTESEPEKAHDCMQIYDNTYTDNRPDDPDIFYETEFDLGGYPDLIFKFTNVEISVNGETLLKTRQRPKNIFLADVTGDGREEVCITESLADKNNSAYDGRYSVTIYDHSERKFYGIKNSASCSQVLKEKDSKLYVDITPLPVYGSSSEEYPLTSSMLTPITYAEPTDDLYEVIKTLRYRECEDGVMITAYKGDSDTLVIPEYINGLPVVGIATLAFHDNNYLEQDEYYIEEDQWVSKDVLKYVFIPKTVRRIGGGLWEGSLGSGTVECFEVDKDNPYFSSEDGVIFNKDMTEILHCPSGKTGVYKIPGGVRKICGREIINSGNDIYNVCGAFEFCFSLTEIIIPDSVVEIGNWAFSCCYSLERLKIPDSVVNIGGNVFHECQNLSEIKIPDSVTDLSYSVYCGSCITSLDRVTIPKNITKIGFGENALVFTGCRRLETANIPEGVTEICDEAFMECIKLKKVILPKTLSKIDLYIDVSGINTYTAFFYCQELSEFAVAEGNSHFTAKDGVLFSKDMTRLIACPSAKTGEYTVPDGVKTIEPFAFCGSLKSINIPDSVKSCSYNAFTMCNALKSVNYKGRTYTPEEFILLFN